MRTEPGWRNRKSASRWAIALAVPAALGLAGLAIAAPSARDRVTVAAQSSATAVATCKPRTTAVATGFASPRFDPANDGPGVARLTSKIVGRHRAVTMGYNFGRESAPLISLGYCVRHGHGLTVRSKKVFLGPESPGSAVATCRRGTKAVGGGFGTPGFSRSTGPRVLTLTSRRVGVRKWRVEALNMGGDSSNGGRPGTLHAYAYCEKDPPKLASKSKRIALPVGQVKTFKVRCPRGARAYSGGFDGNVNLTADPTAAGVVTSKRVGHKRAWQLSAINVSDTSPGHVTAYAYCRLR
jgi:hypothetical protein